MSWRNRRGPVCTAVVIACMLLSTLLAPVVGAGATPVLVWQDDFSDGILDAARWVTPTSSSPGVTMSESGGVFSISVAADASGSTFGDGIDSLCAFSGDFDIRARYNIPTHPADSGVRLGMHVSTADRTLAIERSNWGYTPEHYLQTLVNPSEIHNSGPTAATSGILRTVRVGTVASTMVSHDDGVTWLPIAGTTTGLGGDAVRLRLSVWSHDGIFSHEQTVIAFDDLSVSADQLSCPRTISDDFNDGVIDPTLWTSEVAGNGNSLFESDGQLHFVIDPTSSSRPSYTVLESPCTVDGNWDMQIEYNVISDATQGVVRLGLRQRGIGAETTTLERSDYGPAPPHYLLHVIYPDQIINTTVAAAQTGLLRLSRSGSTVTARISHDGGTIWTTVATASSPFTGVTHAMISSWMEYTLSGLSLTHFALDDFKLTADQLNCPDHPKPDLSITKTHQGDFTTDSPGTYTVTVTNVGTGPTAGPVTVVDTAPVGMTLDGMSGMGWSCVGSGTCSHPGPLEAGGSLPPLSVTARAGTAGTFSNIATVSTALDENAANDTSSDATTVKLPADRVSIQIAGAWTYANSGDLSGNVEVGHGANGAISNIAGNGALPGTQGGIAAISFNIRQFWILSLYTGTITVSDPQAGVVVNAPLFFLPITSSVTNAASGTIRWINFSKWPWAPYTLAWSVTDVT